MNLRLDNLSDDYVRTLIRDWRQQLDEIKNKQVVSGSYNIEYYLNKNNNQYDRSDVSSAFNTFRLRLTFTADNQDFAFAEGLAQFYIDTINSNGLLPDNGRPSTNGYALLNASYVNTNWEDRRVQIWTYDVNIIDPGNHTLYTKFYVGSTDTGTIVASRDF